MNTADAVATALSSRRWAMMIPRAREDTQTPPIRTWPASSPTVLEEVFGNQRDLVLTHELYRLAARDAGFRDIATGSMSRSRAVLERHFDPRPLRCVEGGDVVRIALEFRGSPRRFSASASRG
ncbi:MAG: hypothetical protein QM619_07450 [Micropruina sp.]|uniref:hypothetical protein n=1 Tax=Micropruina sp. TaxID=2737536 RepID=UPI0039E27FC3